MSFQPGAVYEGPEGIQRAGMFGRALRKTGRPVALVSIGAQPHAGHVALIRAARRIPRAAVVLATSVELEDASLKLLRSESVDVVVSYRDEELWPRGERTLVWTAEKGRGLEPEEGVAKDVTRLVALIGAVEPSDVVVGEKDYEVAVGIQRAVADLHLGVAVHGVPTVRMPGGLAISARNARVFEDARDLTIALDAALTAGAHVAERGAAEVERVARAVLSDAGIVPEYVAVRARDLGDAPEVGDARLLVAATIGGVRLIDNVGLPLGVGFKNIENG